MTKKSIESTFKGYRVFITYSVKNKFLKRYEIESVKIILPDSNLGQLDYKYILSLERKEQERIIKEIKIKESK